MTPEDLLPDCCLHAVAHLIRACIGEPATCDQGHDLVYGIGGWHVAGEPRPRSQPRKVRTLTEMPSGEYSATEAVKAAGTTYRKMDYWCRLGWVDGQPTDNGGPGTQRRFTEAQVHRLVELELASKLKRMRHPELVDYIKEHFALVRPIEDVQVQGALL